MKPRRHQKPDLISIARQHFQTGGHGRAADLCREILSDNPQDTQALGFLGVLTAMAENFPAAIKLLRSAVAIEPDNAMLNRNLAKALAGAGNYHESLEYYNKAGILLPNDDVTQYDIACMHLKMGNPQLAERFLHRALELNPRNARARTNMGSVLRDQARFHEAITHYNTALKLDGKIAAALTGLGLTLQESGDIAAASDVLVSTIRQFPENADAHFNLSLCYLIQNNFKKGWKEYEWRWKKDDKLERPFTFPLWDGGQLDNRTILVYAEQGIGDEIMFASCLRDVCARAKKVIIDCEPRLAPLFSRSFPSAVVHGGYQSDNNNWLNAHEAIDLQIPVASLPLYLRKSKVDFPGTRGYLNANPQLKTKWEHYLSGLGTGRKIGIAWKGGGTDLARLSRSIGLTHWDLLLGTPGQHFVNLQYGDYEDEIRAVEKYTTAKIHCPGTDPLVDIDEFAALISSLDLVVTVDNSTAHLAGALGVRTWLLLSQIPDWRWSLNEDTSVWYPSLKLFRNQSNWNEVFTRAVESLLKLNSTED